MGEESKGFIGERGFDTFITLCPKVSPLTLTGVIKAQRAERGKKWRLWKIKRSLRKKKMNN